MFSNAGSCIPYWLAVIMQHSKPGNSWFLEFSNKKPTNTFSFYLIWIFLYCYGNYIRLKHLCTLDSCWNICSMFFRFLTVSLEWFGCYFDLSCFICISVVCSNNSWPSLQITKMLRNFESSDEQIFE